MEWKEEFLFIAHRGGAMHAPENTLTAFKKALESNSDAIEFDIRRTRDGVPVVIHDEDLKRVANIDKRIAEMTLEDLKKIKVFGAETIPTLEEVLQELGSRIIMFIEIKDEGLEDSVVTLLKQYNVVDQSLVISFNYTILTKVKNLYSGIEIGLLSNTPNVPINAAVKSKAMAILPRYTTITPQIIKEAHSKKLKVYAWTINDVAQALKIINYGVDCITTDNLVLKSVITKQLTLAKFFKK
jgi:glycerophosphoryl diester phosphodiesterase